MIYNISSGFDAEMADDIPVEMGRFLLEGVTLWVGEWYSVGGPTWQDPLGLRINLYDECCPPELVPVHSFEFTWEELEKTLVLNTSGSTVYEVTAWLPGAVPATAGSSLGATVLIDWGHDEPFTGICATPMYTYHGYCVCYLDAEWWGYTRWTAIDHYTGIPQDMAYCLHATSSDAPATAAAALTLAAHPNPFNPRSTLRYRLPTEGHARLDVYDLSGRLVRVLADGPHVAGEHSALWDGRDAAGRSAAAGVYVARLVSGKEAVSRKLVLLE